MLIWSSNKVNRDLRDKLISVIEEVYTDRKEFFSSYDIDGEYFSELLLPYYGEVIKEMMQDLGMYKRSTYDYNVWVQMYNSNTNSHPPHQHYEDNEIISFNHIIDASPEKCFYFLNDYDEKIYPGEQKSGDIFAWPPWRMHGVDRATSHRLIVAGNIMLKTFNDSVII
jgi:hypothetical protein